MVARSLCLLIATLCLPTLTEAQAREVYFVAAIGDLEFTEGKLPDRAQFRPNSRSFARLRAMVPYAAVEGAEVYVTSLNFDPFQWTGDTQIALRAESDQDHLSGTLYWPDNDGEKMIRLRFRIDISRASETDRDRFLQEKLSHYVRLLRVDQPGSAWYRHQVRSTQEALGRTPSDTNRRRQFFGSRGNSLEDTFALVSGGRALSENLQLDRALPATAVAEETVALKSIRGINVREYDWEPLVKDLAPSTDPLATLIPDDQHVVFFTNFAAMLAVADNATEQGIPILNLAEPRAEDAQTRRRYERQLGLSLDRGARLLGPSVIDSVALTGSDPYFRTGTDLAFLLEAKNPKLLKQLIDAQVTLAAANYEYAQTVDGRLGGITFNGHCTPDRKLSSYSAVLGQAVVVTNSFAQLTNLVDTFEGRRGSLASLDEYTFFRDRYPRDPSETGLLIISDKTIRRWCGPRWRIASSRRTRAVALMAEVQAKHLDGLVGGDVEPGPVKMPGLAAVAGKMKLSPQGVFSDQFGTLEFQTPIAELTVDAVTKQEAEFYNRWRNGYERAWSNFFDPIAVQVKLTDDKLAADVTVMPLIASSEYRSLMTVSQGAEIGKNDGDPHEGTLLHLALALNHESSTTIGFAGQLGPTLNPLAWIGDTISVYLDDGEFMRGLAEVEPKDLEKYVTSNLHQLPVALHVGVRSGFRLTAFLAIVRTYIEQTAPGMTAWENLEYDQQPYVRVSPTERARSRDNDLDNFSLYYAAGGESLIVTLDESLLKRAIDRREARHAAEQEDKAWQRPGAPWIGKNFNFQIDAVLLSYIEKPLREYYQQAMQVLCWNNLQILNEWKRRYPERDPVEVHEAYWQRKLVCPGGGQYVWNAEWQTMESTVYGHPGEPQAGPTWPASLARLSHGNFGLTFEDDGLRAKIEVLRK